MGGENERCWIANLSGNQHIMILCVEFLQYYLLSWYINMDNGGWYTRKRKASSSSDGTTTGGDNDVSAIAAAKKISNESSNNSNIPKSLSVFL